MKHKMITGLAKLKTKFLGALPIILFFLFLFYTIILFFGISYSILVSVMTILFKVNFRKYLTVRRLLILIGTQFFVALFSFFATLSLPLCLLINLTVPFLLVFLQTSQFNQLGYFANAMCFVFLQLRPVGWEGLPKLMGALAYGMTVLAAALFLCSLHNRKTDPLTPARKGLLILAAALKSESSLKPGEEPSENAVFSILQGLYKEAYKSRGLTRVVSPQGKIQYMFALLFQRAAYFLANPYQAATLNEESCRGVLTDLAQYMELAGEEDLQSEALVLCGKELLAETEGREEAPCIFAQNFLRLFLLILENIRQMEKKETPPCWKLPAPRHPWKKFFRRMKPDTFETRFALRLSMVLTVGLAYNTVSRANHGYWLALNAFLLLRPMYEDSASRMKSRFIGTVAGCFLLQLLLPLFHGFGWHLLLATVMAIGLYMEVAGTWQQAFFSTCFALTLTTMALPQALAFELRLLYVVLAILLVLAANRFFFPTSLKSQFRYNLQQLFHLHHLYLRMLSDSLKAPLDYGVICDVQIHYHLIHDQISDYIKHAEHEDADFLEELLQISWCMVSEAEQMLFLINNRKTAELDAGRLGDYLQFTACILNDIQKKLNMKSEQAVAAAETLAYKRSMEGNPLLSELMEQYSKRVSAMYRCVCRHSKIMY